MASWHLSSPGRAGLKAMPFRWPLWISAVCGQSCFFGNQSLPLATLGSSWVLVDLTGRLAL